MLNTPENIKTIHIFKENISFPVFVYSCSNWDDTQISYLNQKNSRSKFTTLTICKWCISHHIHYQILFPRNKLKLLFKDPGRFLCYLYLKIKKYNF